MTHRNFIPLSNLSTNLSTICLPLNNCYIGIYAYIRNRIIFFVNILFI